ncbi:MAG: FecR domain-containing protein [Thermoanaerobaculia bacterium]|jgi:hypothetical protein
MNDERYEAAGNVLSDDQIGELLRASGPRADLPSLELAAIRAKTCAAWQNESRHSRSAAKRTWITRIAIAAAVGGALLLVWMLRGRVAAPAPVEIATVEFVSGHVTATRDGARTDLVSRGDRIVEGSTITTEGHAARAALRIASGVELRLDEATKATIVSASEFELTGGVVYFDTGVSAGPGKSNGIVVRTESGIARDIGTRFEVRVPDGARAMVVRVRDGRVSVENNGGRHEVAAEKELVVASNGQVTTREIRGWGAGWEWILATSPRYEIEGRTLSEFLAWVARETGWTVRFSDPAIESRARVIVLHGTIEGTRPDEAPFAVLAGSGLEGKLADGVLEVREAN